MSAPQFTPPPWSRGNFRLTRFEVAAADGTPVADIRYPTGTDGPEKVRIANARLIAAAPELYAAAEEAFECFAGELNPRRNNAAMNQLLAALTKATGQ